MHVRQSSLGRHGGLRDRVSRSSQHWQQGPIEFLGDGSGDQVRLIEPSAPSSPQVHGHTAQTHAAVRRHGPKTHGQLSADPPGPRPSAGKFHFQNPLIELFVIGSQTNDAIPCQGFIHAKMATLGQRCPRPAPHTTTRAVFVGLIGLPEWLAVVTGHVR